MHGFDPTVPENSAAAFNPNDFDDDALEAPAQVASTAAITTPAVPTVPKTSAPVAPAPEPATTANVEPAPAPSPTATSEVSTPDPGATLPGEPAATAEPATPAEAGPSEAELAARQRAVQHAKYAKRRRRYSALAVAAVAAGVWLVNPFSALVSAGGGDKVTTTQDAAPAAAAVVKADMAKVHQQLKQTGDLTDVKVTGAQVASAGTSAYVARVLEGQCFVYGVIDGKDIEPQTDPTRQACTGQIQQVQAELDQADQSKRQGAVDDVETVLTNAADSAAFYAGSNFTGGAPSLKGLDPSMLAGARVVANHGDYVELKASSGGTCRTVIVSADGQLGEISPC